MTLNQLIDETNAYNTLSRIFTLSMGRYIGRDLEAAQAALELFRTRTSLAGGIVGCEAQEGHITVDNGAEFETGAYETRTLHIRHISVSSQKRLARLLGVNWYL